MSSGCGDVLSLADLQTAKKHQIFEAEVITGKSGGVATGADIDYATNQVTGQTQKTLPAVLRDAGFSPVSWDFSTGGTLTANDRDKVVYDPVSKTWYSYAGTLPVVVPAGFNPVGNANWKPQTDPDLRNELTAYDGTTVDQIAHRVTTIKTFEEFGAVGDGVANDTSAMLAALSWLEGVPFGKLTGRVGARYRITQSLVMKFDGSYTQDVTSTRYIDFTGTTIVAGASGITCLRMSHDFCHIINPVVINPDNYSDVIAYAIAPEDESQTTVRVSQQFCVMENPRARGTKIGLKFKPGPTVGGSNSGSYYHSIMNPNFERVDCGFYFERSVSGDNNNTRIHIYNPHHATGNCSFWIESTDILRVFGGHSENITTGTWPADVPCAVRIVKTVSSDTSVAGNIHFRGFFGELCTRPYQVDLNVGTYENHFDWSWVYLTESAQRQGANSYESISQFDGVLVSSNMDPDQKNIAGCRRRSSGKGALIIQPDDSSPAELYSDTKWKITSSVLEAPVQDLRNDNSEIQLLGATHAGILITTTTGTKGVTLTSYDGKTSTGNPNGDLTITGYNGFLPGVDNSTVLGYTGHRWSVVYAASGAIVTSDETYKTFTTPSDDEAAREANAAKEIRCSLRRYKFNESVAAKGFESARTHFGVGAQTVESILMSNGLNPDNYAFLCKDELDGRFVYSIRYEELLVFLMMYS